MEASRENGPRAFDSRHNNFDLLRLFAASQVAYLHVASNLQVELTGFLLVLKEFLGYFPGVPIFFVISGYLISGAFDRNPDLRSYAANRFLRIYPALWVSTILTLALLAVFGDRAWIAIRESGQDVMVVLLKWLAAQLTIGQFYNPFVLKANYGVGHLNGSLWTIPVELQFYIVLPFLTAWLWRGLSRWAQNVRLIALTVLLYGLTWVYVARVPELTALSEDLAVLLNVSLPPYLYMFMLGIILQRNHAALSRWLDGKGLPWLLLYLGVAGILYHAWGIRPGGNLPNFLSMTLLAFVVVALAFTKRSAAERILAGNDISYGTYIYHMIVVNLAFELGYARTMNAFAIVLVLTYLLATASWLFVEKPALGLKRRAAPGAGGLQRPTRAARPTGPGG